MDTYNEHTSVFPNRCYTLHYVCSGHCDLMVHWEIRMGLDKKINNRHCDSVCPFFVLLLVCLFLGCFFISAYA